MSINITRSQAAQLLDLFGGEDAAITLDDSDGDLKAWFTDYPDEGHKVLVDADGVTEVPRG